MPQPPKLMTHASPLRLWLAFLVGSILALVVARTAVGQSALFPQGQQEAPSDTTLAPPTSASDSLLEARLRQIFTQIENFQNVTVDVQSGVVRLGGRVPQPQGVDRVEELASQLEGTFYVINDVRAETDVETRITPAVERAQSLLDQFVANLPLLGIALIVILIFWLISRSIAAWQAPARWLGINPLVWQLIRRVLQGIIGIVGLLLAFDLLGVSSLVGAVLGTAGLAGLAIGFAFQDVIENYLAGALLSIQQPFDVNDLVEIGEHQGRVVRLTSRELVLLTLDGNHVRLPNATVFKSVTVNYTRNHRRLFSFEVGIGGQEDLAEVMRIGVDTLEAMNGVMSEPRPFARIATLGESSVVVRLHGWVNQHEADFFKVKSNAIRLVKAAFDEAGIDMPAPTYQVLTQQTEITEEPKAPQRPAAAEASDVDVAPDIEIEAQVEEDLAQSDEPNLLSPREES